MNSKNQKYNLEDRTKTFAKEVRLFIKNVPRSIANNEDLKQLVRSSGSVGANYIEANESLSKKDFIMRIKICRKEIKESIYWLELLELPSSKLTKDRDILIQEATELMKIFGAIVTKSNS